MKRLHITEKQEQLFSEINDFNKKSTLPLWQNLLMTISAGIALIILINSFSVILVEGVSFDQAYKNAGFFLFL